MYFGNWNDVISFKGPIKFQTRYLWSMKIRGRMDWTFTCFRFPLKNGYVTEILENLMSNHSNLISIMAWSVSSTEGQTDNVNWILFSSLLVTWRGVWIIIKFFVFRKDRLNDVIDFCYMCSMCHIWQRVMWWILGTKLFIIFYVNAIFHPRRPLTNLNIRFNILSTFVIFIYLILALHSDYFSIIIKSISFKLFTIFEDTLR